MVKFQNPRKEKRQNYGTLKIEKNKITIGNLRKKKN
jgi:hypothetical protein